MTTRQKVSSGVRYEGIMGYSRAVKIGNQIFVSGTAGVNLQANSDANSDSRADAYSQTKRAIENINSALVKLGSSLSDVVRTRVFTRSDVAWQDVAKAHFEAFGSIMPASTLICTGFLDPKVLVEIEADAVIA